MPKLVVPEIAQSLRERISSGEWLDGRRLPTERDLAREYRVARNTIRRAIDSVAQDGLVTREAGRGTFTARALGQELGPLIQGIAGSSPVEMMAVRMIVEPQAAALAAIHAGAHELERIAGAHEQACAAEEMEPFEHWDAELHQLVFAGSRNQLLEHLHGLLRVIRNQAPWLDLKRRSFSPERRRHYCREHDDLVRALVRRDPDRAAEAMRAHLGTVDSNIFGRSRV